jgi:CDP-glucose 4,6-dehydratase
MNNDRFGNLKKLEGPILITGHTGFKGTWLSVLLEFLDIEHFGISLPPEKNSLFSTLKRTGQVPEKFININDQKNLLIAVEEIQPSVIIHLAAQSLVSESYKNPLETFKTNVLGTANLLNAATNISRLKSIAIITTDKVYRNTGANKKFTELDILGGVDPYSASKVGAEQAVLAWRSLPSSTKEYPILSLRAGNVIGGGDYAKDRLIPDVIRSVEGRKVLEVRNMKATRPWQHVLDPLIGYLMAIEKSLENGKSETFNFGPVENSLPVERVIDIAVQKWPILDNLILESHSREFAESKYLDLDSSKAMKELDWKPKLTQEKAIEATFEWWEAFFRDSTSSLDLCISNIAEFLK